MPPVPEPAGQIELLALVAVARLGDEAYGVSVHQEVCACAARQISVPAVYAALARLEQKGLISCWLSEPRPERGGRARRHYGLTAEGRRTVARERAVAMRMWRRLAPHGGGR